MMKKRYFFFSSGAGAVDRPFIIQINSGADSSFTIPTTGGGYNYKVSTSDGQNFTGVTGSLTITFPSANTLYDVSISGDFPRIIFSNSSQELKLIDIRQWGDIEWTSMEGAFNGCSNMTCSATDVPSFSSVTSMYQMFRNCTSLTTLDVSNWNVSSVTNMHAMFVGCSSLTTLDVSNWNVSSVTNMYAMFYNCTSLTALEVSNWNVSSVTNMQVMFNTCTSLTTLDVSTWDVSSVTNMGYIFSSCTSLTTLDVSNWNVSSVTNMERMFYNCTSLTTLDVSNWNVSSVINMALMFYNCPSLTTLDVSNWDVSSVTNMERMFQSCSNLTSDIDFSDPITGSISLTNINGMMAGTKSERLLLQAENLLSPVDTSGNPSNWIASPNMKEVKLIGMKNDVDTTIGNGSAGAMTGKAWTDLLESFDISQSKTYKLSPTAYSDMETYVQGLGYTDIPDYLVNTGNNWTVIS